MRDDFAFYRKPKKSLFSLGDPLGRPQAWFGQYAPIQNGVLTEIFELLWCFFAKNTEKRTLQHTGATQSGPNCVIVLPQCMPRHPRHFPRGPCPWWCLGSPSCLGVSSITYPLCYRCYQGLLTDYTGVCMGCYCSLLTDLSSVCMGCYWVLVWSLTRVY